MREDISTDSFSKIIETIAGLSARVYRSPANKLKY